MISQLDNRIWAVTALEMAFMPKLYESAQDAAVASILAYFEEASVAGFASETARQALRAELVRSIPVFETIEALLARTRRDLRASVRS